MQETRRGHPRFYELLEELSSIHERKNQNYATKADPLLNFRECEKFGIKPYLGVLIRMSDKWSRLKQLANGAPDMVGESLKDTLMDMACYALLDIILYEEELQGNHPHE